MNINKIKTFQQKINKSKHSLETVSDLPRNLGLKPRTQPCPLPIPPSWSPKPINCVYFFYNIFLHDSWFSLLIFFSFLFFEINQNKTQSYKMECWLENRYAIIWAGWYEFKITNTCSIPNPICCLWILHFCFCFCFFSYWV